MSAKDRLDEIERDNTSPDIRTSPDITVLIAALRAVLEMHAKNKLGYCEVCGDYSYGVWPCPTVREIDNALR